MNAPHGPLGAFLRSLSPEGRAILAESCRRQPPRLDRLDALADRMILRELGAIECEALDRADLAEAAAEAAELIGRAARPAPEPRTRRQAR